jgi:deazaflavin-dependent oxidoreductase (nitroreductase family)
MQKSFAKQTEDAVNIATTFARAKRWMYRGQRPNWMARIANRVWAIVAASGFTANYVVTLEVTGRKSGRIISFPLVMAVVDGERYLVSMLGDNTQWVQNVRAAGGRAVLRSGGREEVQLEELSADQRAPILKAYLQRAEGARPHIPIDQDAPLAEFEMIAAAFPVFRVNRNNLPLKRASTRRSPLTFFVLTFALSSPFWLLGAVIGKQFLPGIPVSSLMVLGPLLAALLLVYRENPRAGVLELLKRSFDYQRINAKVWYAPIILLMPGVMLLEYGVLRWLGSPVPAPQFSVLTALVMFLAVFIAALSEELGWMGYVIDPMQNRSNALQAGILLGLAWSAWHFIPLLQAGRAPAWIAWWSLATVAQRVLIVWLYNNTGKSVFATAVYHAMMNVTWQLFPINGSFYDPRITAVLVTLAAAIVTVVWGPKTLAQYRRKVSNQP